MKKLRAGSLQLVTFIVVAIAILLSSFILLIHIHRQFRLKSNLTIETVGLVNNGINGLLQNNEVHEDTVSIPLRDEGYKSLKVHRGFWGSYGKVHSRAKIKSTELVKTALIGSTTLEQKSPALYIKDNKKPLVLVGNTKIKGKAFLPERGVKSGNISGKSYYGGRFVYGLTETSKDLPKLNTDLLDYLKDLKSGNFKVDNQEYIELNSSKTHQNSFEDTLQLAYSHSDIILSNIGLTGHIVVHSRTRIVIDASAKLEDVIVVAPIIEIKPNVVGSFQAIATERISIDKNVTLAYPSALVLQNDYVKDEHNGSKSIFMADHSKVSGQILVLGETQPNNYDAQVKISANAVVEGMIYCEQNLELRGTVYGSVYTDHFIIKEGGSIYQNHLYNALIDSSELPREFVGLGFDDQKKGIAKWLY
ncbi:polymer-forming cytoskeletal protein [Winogradskyella sp.]|uniref:polymer-forming cytoskeletal protein n=1 Tax=Winogradskyella sp. TaxID=1883156 RepID=UPI001B0863CE|nr:polymer-forming cytoskeletal protein [Winogradskyella sp.]MBO6881086.1 hypothetical protein [Winogradskyella sp.]